MGILFFTYISPPTAEKMRFPVSFTLVFLCLSMANALESFAQQEDFDKIDPVARPSNLTQLTGTVSISDQIFDNIISLGRCRYRPTRLCRLSQSLSTSPSLQQNQAGQDVLCSNLRQRKTNLQKCGGVLSPELEAKKPNKMLS